MIQLDAQLPAIEQLIKLMRKHGVKEVSADWLHVVLTDAPPKAVRKPYTKRRRAQTEEEADQEFLDNHTVPPMPDEPWNDIDQSVIDEYTVTGKLGG